MIPPTPAAGMIGGREPEGAPFPSPEDFEGKGDL